MAAQNLNCLLLYSEGSNPEILQTWEAWVLHVCYVELKTKYRTEHGILLLLIVWRVVFLKFVKMPF